MPKEETATQRARREGREYRVMLMTVPCTKCGKPKGQWCRTTANKPSIVAHEERQQLYARIGEQYAS